MADRARSTSGWLAGLGVITVVAGALLFDLQRWAGTPTWEAAVMAFAVTGACWISAAILADGVTGLDRRVALGMVIGAGMFLLCGALGPLVQSLELTEVQLPLRVSLGATPPLLMIGAVILSIGLRTRRRA